MKSTESWGKGRPCEARWSIGGTKADKSGLGKIGDENYCRTKSGVTAGGRKRPEGVD
jgi:hypothetical protein